MAVPRRQSANVRLVAGLGAIAMSLGIAACGGGGAQSGGIELRFMWWGNPPRHQATNEVIKLYEKKNPNVNIEAIYTSWDGYWDKLATQMAGGNAPDVIQMDYSYLNEYASRDALLDLGDYTGKVLDLNGISDQLVQTGELQGAYYAVPWASNTHSLAMNTAALEDAGLSPPTFGYTWQDLRDFCQRFDAANGADTHAVNDMSSYLNIFEVWLGSYGSSLFTERGELGFDKRTLRDFWVYWQQLRKTGCATPAGVTTGPDVGFAESALVRGTAGVNFTWSNQYTGLAELVEYKPAIVPLPVGEQVGQFLQPGMFLSVSARTEYPTEAAKFIDFLITDKQAGKILGTNRGIPVDESVRSVLADQATGLSKEIFAFQERLADEFRPAPSAPPAGKGELELLFARMGDKVAFGRMSVDEAANEFFSRAQGVLSH